MSCLLTHRAQHTPPPCVYDAYYRRELSTPTQVGPYKVPAGVIVWPMVYAINNSTHNWEEPQLFKPVRPPFMHPFTIVWSPGISGQTDA
jgi:hypothetical protein